jgi:hypothetical protein
MSKSARQGEDRAREQGAGAGRGEGRSARSMAPHTGCPSSGQHGLHAALPPTPTTVALAFPALSKASRTCRFFRGLQVLLEQLDGLPDVEAQRGDVCAGVLDALQERELLAVV